MSTNPRITLHLSRADCHDAIKALASASGRIFTPFEGDALHRKAETSCELAAAIEALREPHDFEWIDVPFADCVRDLCHVYPVHFWSQGSRSMLIPLQKREDRHVPGDASPYRWEGDGVQVCARGLHHTHSRTMDFVRGTSEHRFDNLSLSVGCTLRGGESDRIAEMDNVEARDDLGNAISERRGGTRLDLIPGSAGPFPDEWHTQFFLKNVASEAEKIAWLEADLFEYADYKTGDIAIDLPVSGTQKMIQLWDLTLEFMAFEAGENIENDNKDHDCGPNRHRLRMILHKPKDIRVSTPGEDNSIYPMLLDSSGRTFENAGTEFGGIDFPDHGSLEIEAHFTPRQTSPTQVVLQLARKAQPRERVRFRLENIPLR